MEFKLTSYQEAFGKGLSGESLDQFNGIVALAEGATTIEEFITGLGSEDLTKLLKGVKDVTTGVNLVFQNVEWGTASYKPPVVAGIRKAAAVSKPKAAVKAPGAAPAAGEVPSKRRGNPEALKKAREAKGTKTAEAIEKDKQTALAATKANLTGKDVVHVKQLVNELVEALKDKGSDGKGLSESFIYTTITQAAKDPANGIVRQDMDKRQIGYKLA